MVSAMTQFSEKFSAVIEAIDTANADDPRKVLVDGAELPHEQVYSARMRETLSRVYPEASELLHIAAHAQHLRRWDIPRDAYPEGRDGYNKWRRAARQHHVELISQIMDGAGYSASDINHVASLIKKEQLKKDKESQALENIVAIVFIEHYFEDFAEEHDDYDKAKIIDIVAKTLKKMSPKGHEAALALPLSQSTRSIIMSAIEREKEALAKLAEVAID